MLEGISEDIQNKLEGLAEGALKSLFSLIPPFAIVLGAWDGYKSARLVEFVEELSNKISRIDEDKIDAAYIESEEFYDLFQKCLRVRLQHRSKLKAKFILGLITESVSKDRNQRFNTSIKESFLTLLDEMSDVEQVFLSDFAKGEYKKKSRRDVYQGKDPYTAIALDALYTKGILKDADTWEKCIEISALGREFIEYITILGNQN